MPFPGEERGITMSLQRFRDRHIFERQMLSIGSWQVRRVAFPFVRLSRTDIVRDPRTLRILARHYAGSSGRTDRTRGVRIWKQRALFGESIQMRRVVKRSAVATKIALTKIVHHKKDDVKRSIGTYLY